MCHVSYTRRLVNRTRKYVLVDIPHVDVHARDDDDDARQPERDELTVVALTAQRDQLPAAFA